MRQRTGQEDFWKFTDEEMKRPKTRTCRTFWNTLVTI